LAKTISAALLLCAFVQPASAQTCKEYILELRDWDWVNGWESEDDLFPLTKASAWYNESLSQLYAGAIMLEPFAGWAEAQARFEHSFEHTGDDGYYWIGGEFELNATGVHEGGIETWYKLEVTIDDITGGNPIPVYDGIILQKALSLFDLIWWEDDETVKFDLSSPFIALNSTTYRIRVTATAKVSALAALGTIAAKVDFSEFNIYKSDPCPCYVCTYDNRSYDECRIAANPAACRAIPGFDESEFHAGPQEACDPNFDYDALCPGRPPVSAPSLTGMGIVSVVVLFLVSGTIAISRRRSMTT
jgi:hypothetical protein